MYLNMRNRRKVVILLKYSYMTVLNHVNKCIVSFDFVFPCNIAFYLKINNFLVLLSFSKYA